MSDDIRGMLATLSDAEIKAIMDERHAAAKAAEEREGAEMVALGEDFLNHVIENGTFERTESTGRLGVDYKTVPFKAANGKVYTVTLYVTDVAETERGKIAAKVAQKEKEAAEKRLAAIAAAAERNKALDALVSGE